MNEKQWNTLYMHITSELQRVFQRRVGTIASEAHVKAAIAALGATVAPLVAQVPSLQNYLNAAIEINVAKVNANPIFLGGLKRLEQGRKDVPSNLQGDFDWAAKAFKIVFTTDQPIPAPDDAGVTLAQRIDEMIIELYGDKIENPMAILDILDGFSMVLGSFLAAAGPDAEVYLTKKLKAQIEGTRAERNTEGMTAQ